MFSPLADPSFVKIAIVISKPDGLIRINVTSTDPLSSSTMYSDWLKVTQGAI